MRPLASQLAEDANLMVHRSYYDANNNGLTLSFRRCKILFRQSVSTLTPLTIDPAELISEEDVFQDLTRIDWTTIDFQPLGGEEEVEPAPEDPSTSRHPGNES